MSARAAIWISTFAFMLSGPIAATGTLSIPLTLTERAGVARSGEPVLSGVPLPRAAQVFDPSGLAVVDAATGAVVPADRIVAARWGGAPGDPTKPIKWLWLAFRASVGAGGSRGYLLTDYRPQAPTTTITLTQGGAIWTVDTDAAQFEIATSGFDLFHRVTVGGVELVSPSSENGPYYTLGASSYRAASAQGGSLISVFRQGSAGQTVTLKIKGAHRTFAPGDAILSSDEDLDFNTFLTFSAGSAVVKVHHTVQNNRDWMPLANNADFRNIGSANSVWAEEIGMAVALNLGAAPQWRLATSPTAPPLTGGLDETVAVYQDSSGDANWDDWKNLRGTGADTVETPLYGPNNYVRIRGFEARKGAAAVTTGDKMSGWLDVAGANGGLTVTVRDFWQNFPKALRATASGRVEVGLFPADFRARHNLRVGEQKTHEILFYFHGPGVTDVQGVGGGFSMPLVALAPPSWYAEGSRALPTVSVEASGQYRFATIPAPPATTGHLPVTPAEWDAYLLRHINGPGLSGYSFNGLAEAVPASQMYSWMDFGDIPIDFEGQWSVFPTELGCGGRQRGAGGQYGWKYDGDYGLLLAFLRSGDYRFFDWGLPAARHTADIDYLHHGNQSGRGIASYLDGGSFGHSEHDTDGDLNPHRNGTDPLYELVLDSCNESPDSVWNGTPSLGMVFGAKGLALGYWLTGEPQLAEALLDLGAWLPSTVDNWYDPASDRATANSLESLTAAYWLTGDLTYRTKADQVAAESLLLANPLASGWFNSRMGEAYGGWVATLREQDDLSQDARLTTVAAGAQALDSYSGDGFRADAYGYGALLLPGNKVELMAKADEAFQSAVWWPACICNYGIQRVWQIKEWVNALRSGHAYQLAKYDQLGGPKFTPQAPVVTPTGGAAVQNQKPTAAIAGGPSVSGGTGEAMTFDGSPSTDPETVSTSLAYLWDFGDGYQLSGRQVDHTFQEAGTYVVRLWVSDGEAVAAAQQSAAIAFVNHPPIAAAGPDRTAPTGVALELDGGASSDPDGQALTYTWDFGDGEGASGVTASHAFASPGTFTVSLTVSDGDLSGSDTAAVTVRAVGGTSYTASYQDGVDGYAGTADVRLWEHYPNGNYGGTGELLVANQGPGAGGLANPELHSLIRFALATIPAGARIDLALLRLTASQGGAFPLRVHALQRDWLEGSGTYGDTTDGATWNFFDGGSTWASPGGDFGPPEASFTSPAEAGAAVDVVVTTIVQDWTLGTANDGFMLTMDPAILWSSASFYARNWGTAGQRPKLTITYTPLVGGDPIFADGFEAGSTTAWSSTVP